MFCVINHRLWAAAALAAWIAVAGGTWLPDDAQLAAAQAGLEAQVRRAAAEQHLPLADWSSYTFQYQGQTQAGQRIIFINAFCVPAPADAPRRLLQVFDGGSCYFRTGYVPSEKRYLPVVFNGEG